MDNEKMNNKKDIIETDDDKDFKFIYENKIKNIINNFTKIKVDLEDLLKIPEVKCENCTNHIQKIMKTIDNLEVYLNDLLQSIKYKMFDRLNETIQDLEEVIDAQERVAELAQNEKMDRDKIIKAYELLNEFIRKDSIYKDRLVEAHKSISELSKMEIIDRDKSIEAYEIVEQLANLEMKFYLSVIAAYENVIELSRSEHIDKDNTIKNLKGTISELNKKIEKLNHKEG